MSDAGFLPAIKPILSHTSWNVSEFRDDEDPLLDTINRRAFVSAHLNSVKFSIILYNRYLLNKVFFSFTASKISEFHHTKELLLLESVKGIA